MPRAHRAPRRRLPGTDLPNDHPPAHVHVFKGGVAIIIELGTVSRPPRIREISGMSRLDVVKAVTLIEE